MKSRASILHRAALLGGASLATLALFNAPSRAEEQLFNFNVNAGPVGCCSSYTGPGQGPHDPPPPGGVTFTTTNSGDGAISSALVNVVNLGVRGGAITGHRSNDAYDGYGEVGFRQGANIVVHYGGLNVNRVVNVTNGPGPGPAPTTITTAFANGGIFNAARWVDTITNPTNATISGSISYFGNLGSDAGTRWVGSSSGSNLALSGNRWLSSLGLGQDDPVSTHVFGNNAYTTTTARMVHADGNDHPEWQFPVTVAPGQTQIVVLFDILTASTVYNPANTAPEVALGAQLANLLTNNGQPISADSLAFNFFAGMTVAQLQNVINYSFVGLTIDTSRPFFVQTDFAVNQSPGVFDGGTLKPTTTWTFAQPFVVHAQGGTIDNSNGNLTFNGVLSNVGGLTFTGTNSTILTAANTYTGNTTVNGGSLIVNGSIASSALTTVNAGGTLAGSGIVGNAAINGGTLAPGNPIANQFGPLTVQGSLAFTAASTYLIQVTPATSAVTNVTGSATLGGATVSAIFAPGAYVAKQYNILHATSVSGTFGSVVSTNLPSGFATNISYDASNAFLNLTLGFNVPKGLNTNQANVGNALTNFFNATGGIPMVFGSLTPNGLTQAGGPLATGSQQATSSAMSMFLGLMTDPFIAGRGAALGSEPTPPAQFTADEERALSYAPDGKKRTKRERDAYAAMYTKALNHGPDPDLKPWSIWGAAFGGSQTTDGNAALGSNTATSRVFGVAAGADYLFSPRTLAGFSVAGGGTNFSLANLAGSGRSDLFQVGGFIRHTVGPAYLSTALAYGWQDITTDRTVTIAGVDQLRANFRANAFSGRFEGGYRFVTPWMGMGLTPYAAAQFTTFSLPSYAERALVGANTFALNYAAKDVTATRSELGLRSDRSFAMQDAVLTLRGRVAWAHNYNADRSVGATFQTLPGASFVVNGARQASEAAITTASAEWKWTSGFSLSPTFEGEFSSTTTSYAGKVVAAYSW